MGWGGAPAPRLMADGVKRVGGKTKETKRGAVASSCMSHLVCRGFVKEVRLDMSATTPPLSTTKHMPLVTASRSHRGQPSRLYQGQVVTRATASKQRLNTYIDLCAAH